MIKLLTLLLSVTLLNGQNFVYLLPDELAAFEIWLQSHIKKSHQPIQIFTSSIHYPALHKSFISHQSHGLDLTLVVQSLHNDPLRLIQYQNTHLYHYPSRRVEGTLILLPPYVCHMSTPLDQEILMRSASTVVCCDDPYSFQEAKKVFNTIQNRSRLYLK